MPKYLFEARYSAEGAIGLAKEGGASRRDAVKKHLQEIGGKLESMYFAFGDVDCFVIVELPDNVSAAALSLAVNESGLIACKALMKEGGVIKHDTVRLPLQPLHSAVRAGLIEIANRLGPLVLRWGK